MLRGFDRWGWDYLRQRLRVWRQPAPEHLLFCMVDHFEPFRRVILPDGSITGGADAADAMMHVKDWCSAYRKTVDGILDHDGNPPRHSFFYPWDEYDTRVVDCIGLFCGQGFGEVEVHLHHRGDSVAGLQKRLTACVDCFHRDHGLLGIRDGLPGYAFVHGNWALCNSRPDGDWCGVPQEITILRETGCYMDCTFPSAPSPTQPRFVNRIYYGVDPSAGDLGHQCVAMVTVGGQVPDNSLLMLPGPLGFYRGGARQAGGIRPRLENGEVTGGHPASHARFRAWHKLHLHVAGRPEWLFVKLHTHGLDAMGRAGVTGELARTFHLSLGEWCRASGMQLHYVSARESYNIIKAAEAGKEGNPDRWRDYEVSPPPALASRARPKDSCG